MATSVLLDSADMIDRREAWAAVRRRDPAQDGRFVYAVRTTGIYCRPSCPSRRPSEENVLFFVRPEDAEREGYRPCRRCRGGVTPADLKAREIVQAACREIERRAPETPALSSLAARVGVSPSVLHRMFERHLGVSPRAYAEALRQGRLRSELLRGATVSQATYSAGFGSSSRLYEGAMANLGMTPARYRRGGAGEAIGYTIVASSLGKLLIAATAAGLCAAYFGDSDAELEQDLKREFSSATIQRSDRQVAMLAQLAKDVVEGRAPSEQLPLDIRATAFQSKVWQALQRIPPGSTITYSELARRMGRPTAHRAVARACASNRLAVLIPCHRVVRTDGGLGGYRWGLDRKRRLLERERSA
jgi:AraC family transcriptional regulator of adaptative response/methylated-DNA-[protein]-cysteine methyltransferase